jgi:hypothetical protein
MIDLGGDVTGNGISKLVFTILSAVAENERDRIRERVRDAKRHRVSQRLFNGGKRPFGFDIEKLDERTQRLVPNATAQAALARGRAMRDERKSLREIAAVWASEFGLPRLDAKSVKRIMERDGSAPWFCLMGWLGRPRRSATLYRRAVLLKEAIDGFLAVVPVGNQTRTYRWCSPPRTGRQKTRPALLTVRDRGESLSKDRCVRVPL